MPLDSGDSLPFFCARLGVGERLRGDYDVKLRWELIKDLFRDMPCYIAWDNPLPAAASTENMGATATIGYTF